MVSVAVLNISIVMFNNDIKQIENLLNDIFLNDTVLVNKIYLIDNSPTNKLSLLKDGKRNQIEYIHCPQNLGYGGAHNVSIQKSMEQKIEYHLVLNPDIRIKNTVLANLVSYLENNPDVGLVMPAIYYPNGIRQYVCKLLPTPLNLFSRRVFPKYIADKFNKRYNLLNADYSRAMNVPSLSGCFMFMRTKVLADVGGFDTRFFMYLEDVDLVRRIHVKYKTMFYPEVEVFHEFAKGSYKQFKLMCYHVKSAIKYFNKHGWINDKERRQVNKKFFKHR